MLTAGTTDTDRHIAAIVALKMGQPGRQHVFDLLGKQHHISLRREVVGNRFILAGKRLEFRDPVRVGQEAGIKHEVGILGNAVLEAERFEHQHQLVLFLAEHPGLDELAQVVNAEVGGIDTQVGSRGERCQQVGLLTDRLIQRQLVARQGVQTAALAIALEQSAVVGIEEEAGKFNPPFVANLSQQVLQFFRVTGQVAHVDADRQLVILALDRDDQLGQQVDRQVIYAVVAQIFQHPQGYRLAGARTSTHHD